ncbi:MAG: hypothetical protein GT589_06250 [Peptoclostridium sp.]|nr:hypothetical protein [Peptoclostridium sp.]
MMKRLIVAAMSIVTVLALTACNSTDVVAKVSVTSFESVLNKLGSKVEFDERDNAWALKSPTGERFLIGKDFAGDSDVVQEFDAEPFINAGLEPDKLPSEIYRYDESAGNLRVIGELGSEEFSYSGEPTAIDTFKQVVKTNREAIGYHEKLDHYGIAMGNGNMFEWAKDMAVNDKDIVFVLNPEPFMEAGADPEKVEGWVFAKVEVKDESGKPQQVDKLLKPFELGE